MNHSAIASFSSSLWVGFGAPLANHLWQSTVFAGVVWLLTLLLRRNRAQARYCLWLITSAKFLLPFSLLVGLGSYVGWSKTAAITKPELVFAMQTISQPFSSPNPNPIPPPAAPSVFAAAVRYLPFLFLMVWMCGCVAVFFSWGLRFRHLRLARRAGLLAKSGRELEALRRVEQSSGRSGDIDVILSDSALEPGILGIFRPVLLLPVGISKRLTDEQLDSILNHELCHVRRRDNLAAALHMFIEALFWFHPLVWWIGARLVDERERACDEEVLKLGTDPQVYAESILKVCEFYVESPLFCAAGVTGSNLKRRIEGIMIHRNPRNLDLGMKLLLAATGTGALLVPFGFGLLHAAHRTPESYPSQIATPPFYNAPPPRVYEAVSIRPNKSIPEAPPSAEFRPDGFTATSVTLQILIQLAYGVRDYQIAGAPAWISTQRYDVEARVDDSMADELGRGDVNQLDAEQQPMLLELLADRFNLSVHRETSELPAYALVIARNGSKLHEATPGDTYPDGLRDSSGSGHGELIRMLRGQVIGQGVSLDDLAQALSGDVELGRTVLNRTGLTGKYDFTLQWSDGRMIPREYAVESGSPGIVSKTGRLDPLRPAGFSGPSIFTAIRDRLGLELLESKEQTVPVEMLVIDHAEKIKGEESSQTQQLVQSAEKSQPANAPPNSAGSLFCVFAGVKYPEGTIIQEGVGPEQLCARVMDRGRVNKNGQPRYTEEWIHTNQITRDRGKNIIHITSAAERQNQN